MVFVSTKDAFGLVPCSRIARQPQADDDGGGQDKNPG
jgi:hypothetical protein